MNKKTLIYLAGGCVLIALDLLFALKVFGTLDPWGWITAMFVGGLLFFGFYTINRSSKLLLTPSYILFVLASLSTLLSLNWLRNYFIPTFVLTAITLPLVLAFLKSKRKKWGLIVLVYFLSVISLFIPLLETGVLSDIAIPSFILFSIAIPFLVIYTHNRTRWWALILGGIPFVIGLSLLISKHSARYTTPAVLIFSGLWMISRLFNQKGPRPNNESQREI